MVGSVLIVVAYYSARAIGCRKVSALLCAWMVGLEALVLLQVRSRVTWGGDGVPSPGRGKKEDRVMQSQTR